MKIRALFEAAGNFPIFRAKDMKGGVMVVRSKALRNAIPAKFRVLDSERSTLVYIENDKFYRLINNPTGDTTQDSDWSVILDEGQPELLVGTWNEDNTTPVLQDADASGRNGEYYFVTGAPTDRMVTHSGLFEGNTVTVKNGDMIVSADTKWVVRRYDPQVNIPEELIVRQYVQNINERDNLDRWEGMAVVVKDAVDDPNVGSNISAEYLYKPSSGDADAQGFVLLTNPGLNPAGQVLITTDASLTITSPGVYVYVGTGAATWTLPDIASSANGSEIKIRNRATDDANLILNSANPGEIYDSDGAYDDKLIRSTDNFVTFIAETYWTI